MSKSSLSFIEPHEEEEAKALVEKHLGFEPIKAAGNRMAVKIHVREEDVRQIKNKDGTPMLGQDGKPVFIAVPDSFRAQDQFKNCAALVIYLGPECYTEEKYKKLGPLCKVGDWILIPRNEGTQVNFRGIPVQLLPADRVLSVIEDPNYVTRAER